MRCFNHPVIEAIGICKHCCRGLCTECTSGQGDGLACKGEHETIVERHNFPIAKSILLSGKNSRVTHMSVLIYAGLGILLMAQGLMVIAQGIMHGHDIFTVLIGAFIVLCSAIMFSLCRKNATYARKS